MFDRLVRLPHFADLRARRSRSFRVVGTGRYPPQPKFEPFAFYSCFRLSDPEQLEIIMRNDPYYWTQDNGAGAPVHFAVTYRQIDMLHHILRNCPVAINQRDPRGFTPLHRAAYLAQYDGYLEIYEYLLSRARTPSLPHRRFRPLPRPRHQAPRRRRHQRRRHPRRHQSPRGEVRERPEEARAPRGHRRLVALYDYGPETVYGWPKEHKPEYPERRRTAKLAKEKREYKAKRAAAREAAIAEEVAKLAVSGESAKSAGVADARAAKPEAAPDLDASSPVAFLFPGQGSQCVGMLKSAAHVPEVRSMCDRASEILGYDLLDVCVNGPKSKLATRRSRNPRCSWLVSRRRRNCERTPRTWCVGALASRVSLSASTPRSCSPARCRLRTVFEWSRRAPSR